MDYLIFWENEFPNRTSARDFCGKKVSKLQYRTGNDDSWDIDHIIPLAENGSDSDDNKQIVNRDTNEKKADKITYMIDGVIYQSKKKKNLKQGDKLANYNYSKKVNCVVALERAK